jgi:cysteine synthase
MVKEKLSYKELLNNSAPTLPLNWRKPSGEINRTVIPKQIVGTKANIIVLSPEYFPTGSCNDGAAYFNLKQLVETKKQNSVEVCAFDSAIASYAWAATQFGLKCTIKTPQMSSPYWIKKAKDLGAEVEFEGVKISDAARIIDLNKKKPNFVSQFQNTAAYTYHKIVTGNAIEKAVDGVGDNKVSLLCYPASSGALTGAAISSKKKYPYSKNLLIEPEESSTFYNNKKNTHRMYGMGYGFIPYIHNIYATDYVMLAEEDEVIKTMKCIEDFTAKIAADFNIEIKLVKAMTQKIGLGAFASIVCSINLAQQLRFNENDNIVVIAEDTSTPYKELIKAEQIQDIDSKHIIKESMIDHKFRLFMDVTGQRQRERLFKKKADFWLRRGSDENILNKMRDKDYWDTIN